MGKISRNLKVKKKVTGMKVAEAERNRKYVAWKLDRHLLFKIREIKNVWEIRGKYIF